MNIQKYLDEIKKNDKQGKKINAFLQINPNAVEESKSSKGKLSGKSIAVKANINVLGLNVSCASKTLENYKAPYDATVIKKIKDEGGIVIGMTNMDEFACGASGETSAFGPTKNPVVLDLITGGSSSGSAAAVAADFCDMALGSDTGGSIRNPASHCGVVGLKPTYGSVSRYGLIDLSMSLDQIGTLTKNVSDSELLFSIIKGKDSKDSISLDGKSDDKIKTIGLLDLSGLKVDERIKNLIDETTKKIAEKNKWLVKKIKIDYLDLAVETYYPLVYVEFFSGTRKFDGRRYGEKIENSAGPEVMRRILGGSEISKAEYHGRYYYQSLKAKKLIGQEFEKAFKKVDVIICPTVPRLPHKIGEKISVEEMYSYDVLTTPANLAGICAMSVPCGKINNVPVGIQIMGNKFQEGKLFKLGKEIERL